MKRHNWKLGFTLAEVLITLGIIGVVSALTMPVLIQNYKKHVAVTSLKKTYSTLSNIIQRSEIVNGPVWTWPAYRHAVQTFDMDARDYFDIYWRPYINNVEVCETMRKCGYKNSWRLQDGRYYWANIATTDSGILFRINNNEVVALSVGGTYYTPPMWVDINGPKGDNTFDRDVFVLELPVDTGLRPRGYNSKSIKDHCKKGIEDPFSYCAAKIMNDGWQMADDYPW